MKIKKIILWIIEIIILLLIVVSAMMDPGVTASARDIIFYRLSAVLFLVVLAAGVLIEIDPLKIRKSLPLVRSDKKRFHFLFAGLCLLIGFVVYVVVYNMTSSDFRSLINAQYSSSNETEQMAGLEAEAESESASLADETAQVTETITETAMALEETESTAQIRQSESESERASESEAESESETEKTMETEENVIFVVEETESVDPELIEEETYYFDDADYTVNGLLVHVESITLKRGYKPAGYAVYIAYTVENQNSEEATFGFSNMDGNSFDYAGAKATLTATATTSDIHQVCCSLEAHEKSEHLIGDYYAESIVSARTMQGITYGPIDIGSLYSGENISINLFMNGCIGDSEENMTITFEIEL